MNKILHLTEFIKKKQRTYDEVKDYAFQLSDNWKQETWSRGLRHSKEIGSIKNLAGQITSYYAIKGVLSVKSEDLSENLDKDLNILLNKYWGKNWIIYYEILDAKKRTDLIKRTIIKKYDKSKNS